MPYPNEIAARIVDPDKFDNFARKNIAPGIDIILGIKDGKSEAQAYRFKSDKFTSEQAHKWLKDHDIKTISFEPASDGKNMSDEYCFNCQTLNAEELAAIGATDIGNFSEQTFSVDDKVIMRAGRWRGVDITTQDLDDMVAAFSEVKKDIPLKLGHDEKQALLQRDGYPAAGFVASLKRAGDKLVASFRDIPRAIKELMDKKAYNQVSIEMGINYADNGKKYPRFLKGVALLGADLPAVSGLNDFLALYSDASDKIVSINFSDLIKEGTQMDELKKAQDDLQKQVDENAKLLKETADKDAQLKVFSDAAAKAAADKVAADAESRKVEIKNFIDAQKKEGRILPAHESMIQSVMESLDDTKTVKFADKDGKEIEMTVRKQMEGYIASLPKIVDFSVQTGDGAQSVEFKEKSTDEAGDVNEQKLGHFTDLLMKGDKTLTYERAYTKAKKDHPELCA